MKKKSIRTLENLVNDNLVKKEDLPSLKKVLDDFSLTISDEMYQLIDKTNVDDPIAKQFIPDIQELNISPLERSDPIGDAVHQPLKGIVHRYPDRCLFTPVHACAVYCRFCFRKEKIGDASQTLSHTEIEQAMEYIRQHSEIWEVILTGGDPLILKPAVLKSILNRLSAIPHIEILRIHSRIPVVDSQRINLEMVDALKGGTPVYIVLHANHPKEFTEEASLACAKLVDRGIPMLGQSILLKGINDSIGTLSQLMRCFIKNRIKPYYLHQGDLVKGTEHFRTSIEHGQKLMKELRGRFSGLCQPTYVLDIPGGFGKVPIGPLYIHQQNEHNSYCVEDYCGALHSYSS